MVMFRRRALSCQGPRCSYFILKLWKGWEAGTSEAARFLRRNGFTLSGVREEIVKLLGKADMYFFSPEHPPLTESAQKALNWATDEKNIPGNRF
jgi:hypothetical protein